MSADQVAEIASLVKEVLKAPDGSSLCATFEVVGRSEAWAQVTAEAINVAYPSKDEPRERLSALITLPPCKDVSDWEPMKYVTLAYEPTGALAVAKVVDAALTELFKLGHYSVDGKLEEL